MKPQLVTQSVSRAISPKKHLDPHPQPL